MSRKIQLTASLSLALAAVVTAADRLGAAESKAETLQNQVDNLDAIEALGVNSEVLIKVGRGDTRQEVLGIIRAVKPGEVTVIEATAEADGYEVVGDRTFKVEFTRTGDAFDNEYTVLPESQVSVPADCAVPAPE
jgi:hypothetical protein